MSHPHVTETMKLGNHLYGMCSACRKWIKLTGFFKGIHVCV